MMYAELEQIVCPKCKVPKEVKEFGKDSTKAKGISCWCKLCKKTWRSQHRKNNPEIHKARDFRNDLKKYGLTPESYNIMFESQNGNCACCGRSAEEFRKGLHVDHDHNTGSIRALLCPSCNPGLGYFGDSIERLEKAIAYLKKFKKVG